MKKYKFTGETKIIHTSVRDVKLNRIQAIAGFGTVKAGDIGGWIETEKNLAHDGNAWISEGAQIYGNARVFGNAQIYDNARVFGNAQIYGNAWVFGNAQIYGNARVFSNAQIYDNARVFSNAWVSGNAQISGNAWVSGRHHILVVGPAGSRNGFTTFYRGNNGQIMVTCGCFNGIIDEFAKQVVKTHGKNKHAQVYLAAVELAKLQIQEQHTSNSNPNTEILTK